MRKIKQEQGSIAVYISVVVLSMLLILFAVFLTSSSKIKAQVETTLAVKQSYEADNKKAGEIYKELVGTGGEEEEPQYVQTGLILHYDAIENTENGHSTSTTTWKDLSGNGNDGTIVGGTWTDRSLKFTSSNTSNGVRTSQNFPIDFENTFNIVFKLNKVNNVDVLFGSRTTSSNGFMLFNYSTTNALTFDTKGSGTRVSLGSRLSENKTYDITVTFSGTTANLYVNGELSGTKTFTDASLNMPLSIFTANSQSNAVGNTTIMNHDGSVVVNGSVNNSDGKLGITNHGKSIVLTENGKLSNNEEIRIFNYGEEGAQLDGTIENTGDTTIINKAGDLSVNGTIDNHTGSLAFTNTGNALNFGKNAKVSNDSTVKIVNSGEGGLTVDGTITNTESTAITNNAGQFTVNGKIENTDGNLNLTNKGTAFTAGAESIVSNKNGEVLIQNLGEGGMNLDGVITNSVSMDENNQITGAAGTTSITNTKGDLNINGVITSQDDLAILNEGNKLNASSTSGIVAGGQTRIVNNGEGGMNLDGGIIGFDSIAVTNRGGDMNINGTIANQEYNMNITNTGNKLNINENANIQNSGELLIQNTGAEGMNVNGTLDTNAKVTVLNKAGALNVNGKVNNKSDMVIISNHGTGLNIGENAEINNDKNIRIGNTGADGTVVDGKVTSTEGTVQFINNDGKFEVNGEVTNGTGDIHLLNRGEEGAKINGNVTSKDGNTTVVNANDEAGLEVNGIVASGSKKVTLRNTGKKGIVVNGTAEGGEGVVQQDLRKNK